MAAYKIVQNIGEVAYSASPTSSDPIALKSGYLRIANGTQFVNVAIGTDIDATTNDFAIIANTTEVLKERVSSQGIAGIITGAQTSIDAPQGTGQPFLPGDYVSISGVSPAGINTNWARVVSVLRGRSSEYGPGIRMVLDWDTSGISGPFTLVGSEVRRSVKISFLSSGSSTAQISEVQIAGN